MHLAPLRASSLPLEWWEGGGLKSWQLLCPKSSWATAKCIFSERNFAYVAIIPGRLPSRGGCSVFPGDQLSVVDLLRITQETYLTVGARDLQNEESSHTCLRNKVRVLAASGLL